jgi:Acetylornithine deacetylase/Succinyl-diaminopimelate desuccinylase and related deacylases
VVIGQIDPVGKGYVLSASLIGSADGRVLTAVRETATDEGQLLSAIDGLSKKLRERVGESLVSIRENPPLEQVTTGSLPALRKYSEAFRLDEDDKPEAAIPLLQEAVALDTGFAMAYRKLAVILGNVGGNDAGQVAAATRAYSHRDRLPELEADLTTAYYHQFVDYDPAKAIAAYRAALSINPDNTVALNNLSVALQHGRQWVEAESLAVRATHLGRGASFFQNAASSEVAQGHFDAVDSTLAHYAAKAPASPGLLYLRAETAIGRQDYAAGARLLSQLRAAQPASPGWQAVTTFGLSRLSRLTGRIADAERYLRANMSVNESRGAVGAYLGDAVELGLLQLDFRGRPDSGLAVISTALAKYPLAGVPVPDRPYAHLIAGYGRLGKADEARRLWREYETSVPEAYRRGDMLRSYAAGILAEADRRPAQAEAAYGQWYQEFGECGVCGLFDLARLADQAGRTDSAIALYDRAFAAPSLQRYQLDAVQLAPALKRAGELYEAKGRPGQGRRPLPALRGPVEERRSRAPARRARDSRAARAAVHGAGHLTPPGPPLDDRSLLARLIAFDTTSRASNLPLADFLCDYLDRPGVRIERNPSSDGGKTNLIIGAGPEADDRDGLVLSGHTDVVPADEPDWRSDPFTLTESGDRYVGRGAADMKGFLALAVNRLAAVDPSRLRRPLLLLLTYDEEVGTLGARRFTETYAGAARLPRSVVIGEPTELRVVRAHKGMVRLRLTFRGQAAHSGYPHLGRSAIEPAARAIVALEGLRRTMETERPANADAFPKVPFAALNVGTVAGGSAANVIPDRCEMQLGIRLLPGMTVDAMAERVSETVSAPCARRSRSSR